MIEQLIPFLIESSITMSLLMLAYVILLRGLTHYEHMRAYLLLTMAASIFIGLVSFEVQHLQSLPAEPVLLSLSDYYPTFEAQDEDLYQTTSSATWFERITYDWAASLSILYLITACFYLVLQVLRWTRLNSILSNSDPLVGFEHVHVTHAFHSPCTFRGKIYLPSTILKLSRSEFKKVILHEQAHIDLKHRYDIALMEILKPIFWFNPVYWLLCSELRKVHEFQVDRQVQSTDSGFQYADLLLKLSTPEKRTKLVQGFAQHVIKDRIQRLFSPQSHTMKKVYFGISLPIIALCLNAFTLDHIYMSEFSSPSAMDKHEVRPFIIPMNVEAIVSISAFGMRKNPLTNSAKMHKGIDFVAPAGEPIYAAADGVVSGVEYSAQRYGNKVEILHANGLTTRYAHLSSIDVSKGSTVSQGQVIAQCGSTGLSTGPHLHFEVIKDSIQLDPEKFLSLAPLQQRLASLEVDREALTVIIDAGHGGRDAGVVSGNIQEKDVCFNFAQSLESALKKRGIKTIIIRGSDEFISLGQRTALTKNQSEGIYISLHANQSKNDRASGYEVYIPEQTTTHYEKSSKLARILQSELQGQEIASRGTKTANFTVLASSECPAVLIELGFLTSENDRRLLVDRQYQVEWANKVASSIIKYAE